MANSIRPGQVVLAAALPMPLDGLSTLNLVVERLYGTGETMLDLDGDVMRVIAPKDGFGPLKRRRMPAVEPDDGTRLRAVAVNSGSLDITVEDAADTIQMIAASMLTWFEAAGGINYVTARFAAPGEPEAGYHITVQKADRPDAHTLRQQAETRVAQLEAQLRALGIEPDPEEN